MCFRNSSSIDYIFSISRAPLIFTKIKIYVFGSYIAQRKPQNINCVENLNF